ncbi:L-aspartate oxidase [Hyphomicrobiales bacterium]|jgi:L-aspartate oxidase|nr:L-aspartate oxidase [Hyphomicrobiales bacterium]
MTDKNTVIIIGAGLAGLFTALKLAPLNVKVISSKSLGSGTSSQWAQAGIAAAVGQNDSANLHKHDTISVGAGIVDEYAAGIMVEAGPNRINDLINLGVPFDKGSNNKLLLKKEAAHGINRIVSVNGDMTGKAIMKTLSETVKKSNHIDVIENFNAVELLKDQDGIFGVVIQSNLDNKKEQRLYSRNIIIATGGIGQLYEVTTNAIEAKGDGIAIAARIGADLSDLEFVQFHPTAFNIGIDPAPLATEALRGDGAKIINENEERFLLRSHPEAELAPRDIVARAIYNEIKSGHKVFLDCRGVLGKGMKETFPTVYNFCKKNNIDPEKKPIPIAPAAHYHMGGITTDANGKTNIAGLWACGETASTGVHGANRLASNSLLEAIVFASIIAKNIKSLPNKNLIIKNNKFSQSNVVEINSKDLKILKSIMTNKVGVERNGKELNEAFNDVSILNQKYKKINQINNTIITSLLIIKSAINRKEHRGSHYRSDFPETNPLLKNRSKITIKDIT